MPKWRPFYWCGDGAGIVIVGLVLCGVAIALTAVGSRAGGDVPVPLADVLEQGSLWSFLLPYR